MEHRNLRLAHTVLRLEIPSYEGLYAMALHDFENHILLLLLNIAEPNVFKFVSLAVADFGRAHSAVILCFKVAFGKLNLNVFVPQFDVGEEFIRPKAAAGDAGIDFRLIKVECLQERLVIEVDGVTDCVVHYDGILVAEAVVEEVVHLKPLVVVQLQKCDQLLEYYCSVHASQGNQVAYF